MDKPILVGARVKILSPGDQSLLPTPGVGEIGTVVRIQPEKTVQRWEVKLDSGKVEIFYKDELAEEHPA